MDLRRFITFKTIVEEGSFAQAARKLCCTQSTVTFQIQQLEQELSYPVFEKWAGGWRSHRLENYSYRKYAS